MSIKNIITIYLCRRRIIVDILSHLYVIKFLLFEKNLIFDILTERISKFIYISLLFSIIFSCERLENKDPSFTPEEYIELGLPSHMKIWDVDDYNTACSMLDDLSVTEPLSLPQKGSSKSGEYFKRIVDPDNLSFLLVLIV